MELVKIIKQRIVLNENVYSRYFVDAEGQIIGVPSGLYFKINQSVGNQYTWINVVSSGTDKRADLGTFYANSFSLQCDVIKKQIAAYLASCPVKRSHKHSGVGMKFNDGNYGGVVTPAGVYFFLRSDGKAGFNISVIDAKTLKHKTEFWYCGTPNTWRGRYFKTLKMVLRYKRANDALYDRITVLVGEDE